VDNRDWKGMRVMGAVDLSQGSVVQILRLNFISFLIDSN
jgi:hypothetical protein